MKRSSPSKYSWTILRAFLRSSLYAYKSRHSEVAEGVGDVEDESLYGGGLLQRGRFDFRDAERRLAEDVISVLEKDGSGIDTSNASRAVK